MVPVSKYTKHALRNLRRCNEVLMFYRSMLAYTNMKLPSFHNARLQRKEPGVPIHQSGSLWMLKQMNLLGYGDASTSAFVSDLYKIR